MDRILDKNTPIYVQIMDSVKREIASGATAPGKRILSVREMAQEFGVNPNTIQRALYELEREGLLQTERATGRYVTKDESRIEELRERMARDAAEHFTEEMHSLGYSDDEIANFFRPLLLRDGKIG